jgi:hypothetical protein
MPSANAGRLLTADQRLLQMQDAFSPLINASNRRKVAFSRLIGAACRRRTRSYG